MFKIPLKYRWVYRHLTKSELSSEESCSFDFSMSDLFGHSEERKKFFDFYSNEGLMLAFKRYGLISKLRELKFENIELKSGKREDGSFYLTVYEPPLKKGNIIGEFVGRKTSFDNLFPILKIEWLCLQNPKGLFTGEKPKLPGQDYPGLGLGREALSMIMLAGIRLKFDALMNVPDHFHNSLIYSNTFEFYYPEDAGRLKALKSFMESQSMNLSQMAWALENEKVFVNDNNEPFKWDPAPQILPLRSSLEEKYRSKDYVSTVEASAKQFSFRIEL